MTTCEDFKIMAVRTKYYILQKKILLQIQLLVNEKYVVELHIFKETVDCLTTHYTFLCSSYSLYECQPIELRSNVK